MESIPNPAPLELAPIRLVVSDADGRPKILLGPEGEEVDLLPSIDRIGVEITGAGTIVELALRVDVEIGFPVDRVVQYVEASMLDDLTAAELDRVVQRSGYSTTVGESILKHLRNRGTMRP